MMASLCENSMETSYHPVATSGSSCSSASTESTMTRRFHSVAIECNNVGVRLHRRGDRYHEAAVRAFCDAIHIIKSTPCLESEKEDVSASSRQRAAMLTYELETILAANYRRLEESYHHHFDAKAAATAAGNNEQMQHFEAAPNEVSTYSRPTTNDEQQLESSSAILIYSEPILIEHEHDDDDGGSCHHRAHRHAEITGTIIFNMAMSHHMHGMQSGGHHRPSLEKAMALYEMAHVAASSLLKTEAESAPTAATSTSTSTSGSTTTQNSNSNKSRVLSIIMGSLNNLGQIHYVLHQLQATLVYFDEMSKVYFEHGYDGGGMGGSSSSSSSCWSGFWTNLFRFDCPQSAPAA